jgi:hypothetical protein
MQRAHMTCAQHTHQTLTTKYEKSITEKIKIHVKNYKLHNHKQ